MAEPLVLIHGVTATWRAWHRVEQLLAEDFKVLPVALPGHVDGEPLSGAATIELLCDGVERLMDQAGLETAHVAGNSLGGWLAMELAQRGRARSATLLAPAGGWTAYDPRMKKIFYGMRRQLRASRRLLPVMMRIGLLRRVGFRIVAKYGDRLTPEEAITAAQAALFVELDDLLTLVDESAGPYDDPGVPVLLAWCEHDRVFPERPYGANWRRSAPFAEWRMLPGVGHVPMVDDPALVAQTIRDGVARAMAAT